MILAVCANPSVDTWARLENFETGKPNRIEEERHYPGGKGIHVALAAAELGEEVRLLGFWAGPTGAWIRERCREAGVETMGPEVAGWNRSCYTFQSEGPLRDTELLGRGPQVNADAVGEFRARFAEWAARSDVAVISGSLPAGAPADLYPDLVREANARQVAAILDFTGEPLQRALAASPFGLHLNHREARTAGGDRSLAELAREFAPDVPWFALTAGSEGLYLRTEGSVLHGSVTIRPVASTVGSGDCLTAGLAVARARGHSAEDTVRLAVACGAANCLREDLGMLHRRDVDALFREVRVEGGSHGEV